MCNGVFCDWRLLPFPAGLAIGEFGSKSKGCRFNSRPGQIFFCYIYTHKIFHKKS